MSDFHQQRSVFVRIMIVGFLSILIIRLLFLQVFGSGGFKEASQNQAVKRRIVIPARGLMLDRKGKVLLNNTFNYDLVVQPKKLRENFDTTFFCKLANITIDDFNAKLKEIVFTYGWDRNAVFIKNLSPIMMARLQENLNYFQGIDLEEHLERAYPNHIGASFIGYVNEVSKEMLAREKYKHYRRGDLAGITGLENFYEKELRGKPGVSYLLQDVKQRIIGPYHEGDYDTIAIPGQTLNLYLDLELQKLTEEMMHGKLGSAIAIDPKTGGILAFVSSPTYDPELLSGNEKSKNFRRLLNDATKPMYNRAIMASYAPGSTFKPITALVGLDIGVISAHYGYPCHGGYYACGKRIGCTHSGGGHAANLRLAIANSCNAYFCHVFRLAVDSPANKSVRNGVERWHQYMTNFGLGHPTGIDIPSEKGGNIPSLSYFDRMYNKSWNSCNMSILGMGQGELLLTPLQMANAMCIIANRGYYYVPHFVKAIDKDSNVEKLKPFLKKNVVAHISDSNFNAVIDGMQAVVDQGTARIARIPNIEVCGKTGTVENYRIINGKRIKLKNHSMFVAFAPRNNPKIAIAVAVENAGYGATWAGPIASLMIEQYLNDTIAPNRKALVSKMKTGKVIPSYVYLIDSIEKQIAKEKWRLELQRRDSLKRIEKYKDSLKKINPQANKINRYQYLRYFFIKPKNRKIEYA